MEPDAPLTAAHLHAFVRHIDDRLDTLRLEMQEGFASVDARLTQLETRLGHVETRLTHIETRLTHVETRLDQLDMRLNQMDGRFLHLDSRLGRLDARPLATPVLLAGLTAGVALAVSLFALLR